MMVAALELAGADSGAPGLLRKADSVRVIRGMWRYGDPAREVAHRLGCGAVETTGTLFGGNFVQVTVNDAAREIAAGRHSVILIAGGENGRSYALSKRAGVKLPYVEAPGNPDRMFGEDKPMSHPAEIARGIRRATEMYALFESAIRSTRGESLTDHATRIAKLWEGFSRVAVDNPNAWIRKLYSAEQIGHVSADNPMICSPYPRLMNSNARVDMGAGLIMCSLEVAREAGVPEEKIVFIHSGTEANEAQTASTRDNLHSSPAMRIAGSRALELAGVSVEEVDHFDVYSCFPSAVQLAAEALGIPADRPLTVTGGNTFGGGPLNDYVLHAIARMVEVLREDKGTMGMVTSNGGYLAKHAFGIYSTEPPKDGFQYANLQSEVDAEPQREAIVDWEGPVTVEAYTVAHSRGEPKVGYAACLTPDGRRTWARIEDPQLLDLMLREEICGRSGRLDGSGGLDLS
jgi:acetyl-CoA C-acetyltransferase